MTTCDGKVTIATVHVGGRGCGCRNHSAAAPANPVPCPCQQIRPKRRLHSVCGAVFGIFVGLHLLVLTTALVPQRFARNTRVLEVLVDNLPFLEVVAIMLPLVLLLASGLYLLVKAGFRYNVRQAVRDGKLRSLLQRLSALVLLAFLVLHVATFSRWGLHALFRVTHAPALAAYTAGSLFDPARPLESIALAVRHPWDASDTSSAALLMGFYLCAVLAFSYHLANGLRTGAKVWGLCPTPSAQQRWARCCAALGLLLSIVALVAWYAVTLAPAVHG